MRIGPMKKDHASLSDDDGITCSKRKAITRVWKEATVYKYSVSSQKGKAPGVWYEQLAMETQLGENSAKTAMRSEKEPFDSEKC